MQLWAGEGICVTSSGNTKSKDDIIPVVVIVVSSGRHHSASSLRVNLEQTEEEERRFQNSKDSCRIASCSAAPVTLDSPVSDTSSQVDLSQLDLHLKREGAYSHTWKAYVKTLPD